MRLQQLMDILVEVCYKHVPVRKSSRNNPTQIPRQRRKLMRKRRKFSLQLESSTSDSRKVQLKQKLILIEMLLQTSNVEARTRKEQLAVKAIKTNPRFFSSYAKQYSVTKSSVDFVENGFYHRVQRPKMNTEFCILYSVSKYLFY